MKDDFVNVFGHERQGARPRVPGHVTMHYETHPGPLVLELSSPGLLARVLLMWWRRPAGLRYLS